MATLIFYSKSACMHSDQQREMLVKGGNTVHCTDISAIKWTREKLLPFVRGKEPLEIMDSGSPEIRTGAIDPLLISFDHALTLLVASPHLIKGPLIKADNIHMQGLQDRRIEKYAGKHQKTPKPMPRQKRQREQSVRQPQWQTANQWQTAFTEAFAQSYSLARH